MPDASQKRLSLRQRAEQLLDARAAKTPTLPTEDVQALIHELNVHQTELEIQNEKLRHAQVELAETRDCFADLYEFAPIGYLTLDPDGNILAANLTAARMLGVERAHLGAANLSQFVAPHSQDDWFRHRQAIFDDERKVMTELGLHRADATPLEVRLESIVAGPADQRHCRTALIDVTEVREAGRQLHDSEERYRRLTETVIDYVFTVSLADGQAVETIHSANCERITGHTVEELKTNNLLWIAMVPTEDRPLVEHHVRQTLAGESPAPLEHRIRRKDGSERWVLRFTSAQYDGQGTLVAYDGLLRDITAQKEAELALRELNIHLGSTLSDRGSELRQSIDQVKLLTEAIANLGEGVLITSDFLDWPGPKIVFVNEAMCRITGYGSEELIGQTPRILQSDGSNRTTLDQIKKDLIANRPCLAQLINYRKDGTRYDAEVFITPLFNADGHRTNFVSIHRDVTERNRARTALQLSEQSLADFFAEAPVGLLIVDPDGHILRANGKAGIILGSTSPVQGRELAGFFADPELPKQLLGQLAAGGTVVTRRARIGNGGGPIRHVLIDANSRHEEGRQKHSRWFLRDITARVKLEREVITIGDRERERFAHDLHDDLCQRLTGCEFLTTTLAADLDGLCGEGARQARRIGALIGETIELGRTLAHGLSPLSAGEIELGNALEKLAEDTGRIFRRNCTYHGPKTVTLPDRTVALHLYRIAQEAVGNAVKHGRAEDIEIHLTRTRGRVKLLIHDNGCGLPQKSSGTGFGLRIMSHRAAVIDGTCTARRREAGGTEVLCTVVLHHLKPQHES